MTTALLLSLTLGAAPAAAAADAAPAPAAAAPQDVPDKDRQPNPGTPDGGVTPYALKDFDETVKGDLKAMEADAKENLRAFDAQNAAQEELETRQLKKKFEFQRKLRDERAAFEKAMIDDWKKFVEKLRATEPAERGTEKIAYDQRAMERRRKYDDELTAKNKDFIEKQQRERDEFWRKLQQDNSERTRQQQEHAPKWGKPSAGR